MYLNKLILLILTINMLFASNLFAQDSNQLQLTLQEKQYLKNHKTITVHNELNWKPFNFYANNKPQGYSISYMNLLAKKLNINVKYISGPTWSEFIDMIKTNKLDVMLNIIQTKDRLKYLAYTTEYKNFTHTIYSRNDAQYNSLKELHGKTIALVKGFSSVELITRNHPQIKILAVANEAESFKAVSLGQAEALVSLQPVANSMMDDLLIFNLVPTGEAIYKNNLPMTVNLSIATNKNNPILRDILQKAMDSLTYDELQDIDRKWLVPKNIDYSLVLKILIAVLILAMIAFYYQRKLYRLNSSLEKRTQELQELNDSLEIRVKKEVTQNIEQLETLQQQSKMASMGEMIASIAHQWRQPLAVVSITSAILKEKNNLNKLSKEELNEQIDDIEINIQQMSQTIEDFLVFFNPDKTMEEFAVLDAVEKSISLMKQTIIKQNINIVTNISKNIKINGFKEEYIQVLLSIITNSIQVLKTKDEKNIYIKSVKSNNKIILEISDTGGGIPKDIINRIFEPYFTTKHQSSGTGLGLYIAKMIIENSMNGVLRVDNTNYGAKFYIEIKE